MKVSSSFALLLACGMSVPTTVVGRSDVYCLTQDDCKQRQQELGLKKFKSGKYGNMGRGCFSKYTTLYWSVGGSYKQQTTTDLGSTAKKRVMCGEAEQISTVAPTNEPTAAAVVTDTPTIIPEVTYINETENATNSTTVGLSPSNFTVYQNSTSQDDTATDPAESLLASDESDTGTNYTSNETDVGEEVVHGEVTEAYLTDSKQMKASDRLLGVGVAVFSIGLLLVAAYVHRSKQRSKNQNENIEPITEMSTENARPESFDVENGSTDDLAQNTIEVFEAASEGVDDMGCWSTPNYNQHSLASSTSFGDGSSENMWTSIGTESTYREEESVETSKRSNMT
mmetsp:Transcript_30155/g.60581  ORF Transcript_30155/g.60581 Transcript_30155/m.60581 type:complete len:340 (-) Transcript_30155:95-1114(-)